MIKTISRSRNTTIYKKLLAENYPALVAHIVSSRINEAQSDTNIHKIISPTLSGLFPPALLADVPCAADRIVSAIRHEETIGLVSDYDCDGITSHAILYESLTKIFGVPPDRIQSYIGSRISDGYGLSANIASRILQTAPARPNLIITSDCGTTDEINIASLKNAGIDVIVTDHQMLPNDGIPSSAYAVVNPQRDDCQYPDKSIAGVTVSWLLMCQVRRCLIDAGLIGDSLTMSYLLDFVAVGTVADSVSLLSPTNRAIVNAGLVKMNASNRPCWLALRSLLSKNDNGFTSQDLAFQIAPRISDRGRISDAGAAFQYLMAGNLTDAENGLKQLDDDNRRRKEIEKQMMEIASSFIDSHVTPEIPAIVIGHNKFHDGVQGIVASRLVEKYARPVIVLSPKLGDGEKLVGSARGVEGVDLYKALRDIPSSNPRILEAFGGHKEAAGMTLSRAMVPELRLAFSKAVQSQVGDKRFSDRIFYIDGDFDELPDDALQQIKSLEPYGTGFEEPLFSGHFKVLSAKTMDAEGLPLSMVLKSQKGKEVHGTWFRAKNSYRDPALIGEGGEIDCVFSLSEDVLRVDGSGQINLKEASYADKNH
ncbi:MAG: DHH family phosphoesterase [Pseudomonadota bacterium]